MLSSALQWSFCPCLSMMSWSSSAGERHVSGGNGHGHGHGHGTRQARAAVCKGLAGADSRSKLGAQLNTLRPQPGADPPAHPQTPCVPTPNIATHKHPYLPHWRSANPRDHMVNVWGYSHLNFFAPMSRFGSGAPSVAGWGGWVWGAEVVAGVE